MLLSGCLCCFPCGRKERKDFPLLYHLCCVKPKLLFSIFLCLGHLHDISSFLNDAMKTLIARPQTVDEITEDNLKYKNLKDKKEEVIFFCTTKSPLHRGGHCRIQQTLSWHCIWVFNMPSGYGEWEICSNLSYPCTVLHALLGQGRKHQALVPWPNGGAWPSRGYGMWLQVYCPLSEWVSQVGWAPSSACM